MICFVGFGVAAMLFTYRQTRSTLMRDTRERIDNAGKQADSTFNTIRSIYYSLSETPELLGYMSGPMADRAYTLLRFFSSGRLYGIEADDFAMMSREFDWSLLYSHDELLTFAERTSGAQMMPVGLAQPVPTRNPHMQLVFAGGVYGQQGNERLGYIFISLRPESLIKSPLNSEIVPISYYFEDGSGTLYPLFEQSSLQEQKDAEDLILQAYSQKAQQLSPELQLFKGQRHLVYVYQIGESDCNLIGVTPIERARRRSVFTLLFVVLIFSSIIALVLVLFRFVFCQIVQPVNQLDKSIQHAQKSGHLPVDFSDPVKNGCAEMVSLGSELNKLMKLNNDLNQSLLHATQTLYQVELAKERAEISHLRSQINPHFLYNTLETIKGLALEDGDTRIADISTAMGKMFRYSIKGQNLVPLSDEIEIAKAYLQIQTTRFPGKIDVVFSMADNVGTCYVNKMLLQPILENSIVHGLTCLENGGILWVGGKCEGERLILTIQDNGKGIPPEKLAEIRQQLGEVSEGGDNSHIGLKNVHRRMRLRYGEPFGVEIFSEPGAGTRVMLYLPVLTTPEEPEFDSVSFPKE